MKFVLKGLAIAAAFAIAFLGISNTALADSGSLPLLTEEIFRDRLESPIFRDGVPTVDLTELAIDLRSEKDSFGDRFFEDLQQKLSQVDPPLALDLSGSTVRGSFDFGRLGTEVPLYGSRVSGLLSEEERKQLDRDRQRLSQLRQLSRSMLLESDLSKTDDLKVTVFRGRLNFSRTRFLNDVDLTNTFFLDRVEGVSAVFAGKTNASDARFSQDLRLTNARFLDTVSFRNSIFSGALNASNVQFEGTVSFAGATFENSTDFHQNTFKKPTDFERVKFVGSADFSKTEWRDRAWFPKTKFVDFLFLTNANFLATVNFREARFDCPVNLRGASLSALADFSDTQFSPKAYLNLSNLTFDSDSAKLTGNPGQIGREISIPILQGNENLLRNLIRNFRELEQIEDANQLNYIKVRLAQTESIKKLFGTNLNTASFENLRVIGFSKMQAAELIKRRQKQPFSSVSEILDLDSIDLSTYVKVRDRLVATLPLSKFGILKLILKIAGISILLVLSRYGTSFSLVFGVGAIGIGYFAVLFWAVDRFRRRRPKPIVPTSEETLWMSISFIVIVGLGLMEVFRSSPQPWLTLGCLTTAIVPVPGILLFKIYRDGRYHDLMELSYFVEDGGMRQLRLTIGRLPIMPRFPFFRDRFEPILCDRRWNWLNYYDFSLNNLFKFCFNDIRLRDRHLPGLMSALAWYQWGLGLLYVTLLLWTLSRTIPGLNLFLYLK
ncbi:pentapeptide repeat-containing protein [Baaleninema sp.]|uniref:pentapeptide repeat-containing protein n=1 Tax=Baaleninema sp. TaxID=3101197 RepID=UPI003D03750A